MRATPTTTLTANGRVSVASAVVANTSVYGCFLRYGATAAGVNYEAYDYVDFDSEL